MRSSLLLARIAPQDVAMFRFLLEAQDNLAIFTVLERNTALLKIMFAPEFRGEVEKALEAIGQTVPLLISPWPFEQHKTEDL